MSSAKKPSILDPDWSEHPSDLVSLIPVYGAAREATADWHDGDYLGAAGNALLAVSDLIPAGAVAKVGVKAAVRGGAKLAANQGVRSAAREALRGVVKPTGSTSWNALSKDLSKAGLKPKGTEGHHWGVRQSSGAVSDRVINQPANIMVLPKDKHRRLHGSWKGDPRYNPAEFIWHGSPHWAKAGAVSILGHTPSEYPTRGEKK